MRVLSFFFICLFLPMFLSGANDIVGSDGLIVEQLFFRFDGKNNRIANGAIMTEGFGLKDSLATASFDSFFSVTGLILMQQGTLYLTKDLLLGNASMFVNSGIFEGQGHVIEFPCRKKLTFISPPCTRTWTEIDQVNIGDDAFSVDWSCDGKWLAAGRDSTSGAELRIFSFNGQALTETFTWELGGDVNSVRWHPDQLFLAVGQNNVGGEDLRIFKINAENTTIQQTEAVELGASVRAVSWHPKGTHLAMGRNGGSDEIRTFEFDDSVGSLSNQIAFDFAPNQAVQRNALSWDPTGSYFVTGLADNGTEPQVVIFFFDGITITETQGVFVAGAANAESVDWSPCGTYIAAGFDAGTDRLRVYEFITSTGSLQEFTQARVGEDDDDVQGLHWSPDGQCLAFARDANGSGSEVRTYYFDKSTQRLRLIDEQDRGSGSSNDLSGIRWAPNGRFFATSDDGNSVRVYAIDENDTFIFRDTNLCFNSDVCIATTVEFSGDMIINARGNILDVINGSTLYIDSGSRVCLRNVHLQEIGHFSGNIVLRDNTSQLRLSNVTIELGYDVTTTVGNIYIDGPGTWYVRDFDWLFSQAATLTVDSVTLWKDSVGISLKNSGAIEVGTNEEFFDSLNSGTVKCTISTDNKNIPPRNLLSNAVVDIAHPRADTLLHNSQRTDFLIGPMQDRTMIDNMYLATNRRLRVGLDSLLSGSGHYIDFHSVSEPLLLLDAGVTLSLKDVVLKNFLPHHVRYGDINSRLLFGPGTVIELGSNASLSATVNGIADTPITWTFITDTTKQGVLLKGFGHCLNIPTTNSIGILVDSFATLTLHHLRLSGLGGAQINNGTFGTKPFNLRALHPASRIVTKETVLVLDGNYTFSEGILEIVGDTWVSGTYIFGYQSPQTSYICSGARLIFDYGTTLSYDAIPGGTLGDDAKRKLQFESQSAILQLKGATLHATHTGLLLEKGAIHINDDCYFTNEAVNSAEQSVLVVDANNGNALTLNLHASAHFTLDGLFETR